MVKKKQPFPKENDLVICTVTKVFSHGAFAKLDEYGGKEGFVHISEVASTWIKNIRDYVKEGQKTVSKVLGVDENKGHIDISLRRVGEAQKKNKMMEWKRAQKADKLMEIAAKEIGKTLDDAYEAAGFKLEERYGEIYNGLEEIVIAGEDSLKGLNIADEWMTSIVKIARENIDLPSVNITGYLDLNCYLPNGIDLIKKALIATKSEDYGEAQIDIRYIKSPRFSINVTASNYKLAEEALKKCAEKAIEEMEKLGGIGKFSREQK